MESSGLRSHMKRDAQALLDSERARHAVGEVAVPYRTCSEPSNVQAGGGASPSDTALFRQQVGNIFQIDVPYKSFNINNIVHAAPGRARGGPDRRRRLRSRGPLPGADLPARRGRHRHRRADRRDPRRVRGRLRRPAVGPARPSRQAMPGPAVGVPALPAGGVHPRHAANLLRLKAFFARQWQQMPAAQFMAVFGPYAARIGQVLDCHPPQLLAALAAEVGDHDGELPLRA